LTYTGSKEKQNVLAVEVKESIDVNTISNFTYDPRKAIELCSHMILFYEFPFTFVEDVLFNKLIMAITLHWENFLGLLQRVIALPLMK
jgi:hypothetical protein